MLIAGHPAEDAIGLGLRHVSVSMETFNLVSRSSLKHLVGPSAYRGYGEHLAKTKCVFEGCDGALYSGRAEYRTTRGNWRAHAVGKEAVDTFRP
jgi:hypothetical protein